MANSWSRFSGSVSCFDVALLCQTVPKHQRQEAKVSLKATGLLMGLAVVAAVPSASPLLNLIEFVGENKRWEAAPLPRGRADVRPYRAEQSESRAASGEVPSWLN